MTLYSLWIDFKHWLIKKLGGYTEIPSLPLETISAEARISYDKVWSIDSLATKYRIVEALAKEIYSKGYYRLQISEDDRSRETILRVYVDVSTRWRT